MLKITHTKLNSCLFLCAGEIYSIQSTVRFSFKTLFKKF